MPAGGIEPNHGYKTADLQSTEPTTLLNTGIEFEVFQLQKVLFNKTMKPQNLPQEDDQSSCSDSERRFTDLQFWYRRTVHHAVSIPGDDGASPVDRAKIWFVWWVGSSDLVQSWPFPGDRH